MRLVIGKGGFGFKRFSATHGAVFIWYERDTGMLKMWGYPETKD